MLQKQTIGIQVWDLLHYKIIMFNIFKKIKDKIEYFNREQNTHNKIKTLELKKITTEST